jgi:hypothetical protein
VETTLYKPVKTYLEGLGFTVKGEIGSCDMVALDGSDPAFVVICELKLSFNLELVLQGVDRAAACDEVWLAVRASGQGRGRESDPRVRKLCRLLGFGLIAVAGSGRVDVLVEPGAWRPRADKSRRSRLVAEHLRRRGDPVEGGGSRAPVMTAYRQQALICCEAMREGPRRPRDLKAQAPEAAKILRRNVYGWFEKIDRGLYGLTAAGLAALERWPQEPRQAA